MIQKISESRPIRVDKKYLDNGDYIQRVIVLLQNEPKESIEREGFSSLAETWEEAVTTVGKAFADQWMRNDADLTEEIVEAFQKTASCSYNPGSTEGKVFRARDKNGVTIKVVRQGNRGILELRHTHHTRIPTEHRFVAHRIPMVADPVEEGPVYYTLRQLESMGLIAIEKIKDRVLVF